MDTGVLVALLDRDDPHHGEAEGLLAREKGPFIVPSAVLPEVCYLAQKYLGAAAERAFVESLVREELPVDWTTPRDLGRAAEVMAERPELGLVDCLIVAAAERLKVRRLGTLDRRHFSGFRPRHCSAFELLP
ncbi:PIN domain-containing protein [bacterium]|nr:MAG: PIN domain-containing protein [bacterium]